MALKITRVSDQDALSLVRGSPCIVCTRPSDPAHIKSKGSGGPDSSWNLAALCRVHHTEQHAIGWVTFARKYIRVQIDLKAKGWVIENGRLWNEALAKA